MNTIEATTKARELIMAVLNKQADTVSGCEKKEGAWQVTLEVVETKAQIADNDLIASYQVDIDAKGEVTGYTRLTRYQRAHATQVVAA